MGAVTYPDLFVATLLNEYFIPVQVNIQQATKLAAKFNALWTPNINILDGGENLVYHNEGWLPPSEFSAMLMVSRGHFFLRNKRYEDAISVFQEVWNKFPASSFASQALYYLGVSRYMSSHKAEDLIDGWKLLQRYYPRSLWAIRSSIV